MVNGEQESHVLNRRITSLGEIPDDLVEASSGAICAQDLYQRLNPDQERPKYSVVVSSVDMTEGQLYTVNMLVSAADIPLAEASITRQLV